MKTICAKCRTDDGVTDRFSFGIYAGRYCDSCWKTSGYRDATDPDAVFDPMDAGEQLEPDEPNDLSELG